MKAAKPRSDRGKPRPNRRGHADLADLPVDEYHRAVARRIVKPTTPERMRLVRYGLTEAEYQRLLKKQKNACAICLGKKPLVVDHCHETNVVRGLLCSTCNSAIGKLKDDPEVIERAAKYVRRAAICTVRK